MHRHSLGEIWEDQKGEVQIKTEHGTQSYYRFLVEQYLGFPIPKGFTVHHIDFNHNNNTLENFLLIPTSLHIYIHRTKCKTLASNLEQFKKKYKNKEE